MWDSLQDNQLSLLKKSVSKKKNAGGGDSSQSKETKEAYKQTNKQKS